MTTYILDACALISVAKKDKNYQVVQSILQNSSIGQATVYIHKINLLETFNYISKHKDHETAQTMVRAISCLNVQVVEEIDIEVASGFYTRFKTPLADSIAVSTAHAKRGTLVTADYKDMKVIAEYLDSPAFLWI
jgi:predicted nucleic acid-binding protein